MLIAVASKDGKEINQHFGHAERFLIYEVKGTRRRAGGREEGRALLHL